jgi:glutamate dehydrogenase
MKTLKEIAETSVLNESQLQKIEEIILSHGNYTQLAVRDELDWFCAGLGMSPYYFKSTPLETIANHIEAIKAAEIMATVRKEKVVRIDLSTELENEAIYLVDDFHYRALEIERKIEEKYPNYRLQSYRTLRKTLGVEHLRMYVVERPKFPADKALPEETDIHKIADKKFLATVPQETRQRFQQLLVQAKGWETPLIDVSHDVKNKEMRISVVTNRDSSHRFFSNVSDVINSHGLVSIRKYAEHFANGKTVYSFYLDDIQNERLLQDLIEDVTLIYVIPECPLSTLFREGRLKAQETVFGLAAWSFAHQFLSGYNEEYLKLADELKGSPELLGILRNLKTKLVKDTYTESRVWDSFLDNYEYVKKLFALFDKKFNPHLKEHNIQEDIASLKKEIVRKLTIEIDRDIFLAALTFINVSLKTNFYVKEKTSLSFLLEPKFLNKVDYPETPYSIIFVFGSDFRGYHVRFRDIARGGIRIVRSSNIQNYLNNSDFIFDENYGLASTQQRKNKDLPDGGSKGTILLRWGFQDKGESAFKKYIDGLLDLLLPDPQIVDYYGKETILFLGPDEGTAELMEWASLRAKIRGYKFWKSFTTGKPVSMGGIPHDLYGMTTNSVHEYVIQTLNKLGLKEEQITKVMTGGPDGDLGSNEILISKDKILAIIDGSGVLYDPEGINRKELEKLAKKRKTIENFDRKLLFRQGFLVSIKDHDIILPDGEKVDNGLDFRNTFHLHPKFKADLFVPCGGRPASVNINNWTTYINEKGEPRFKIIVEGANLFLTQEARIRLEEKGVIIYKDASANKGGVTSSHLEVLASLALTDKEYDELMCVKNGVIPAFRKKYVQEILESVRENAALEFEIIWKENERRKISRAILTDMVSEKINQIKDSVNKSDLMNDKVLFKKVIECCCPPILVKTIGPDKIHKRVPATYLKALFASRLAGRYVYKYGLDANEIDFFEFLREFK